MSGKHLLSDVKISGRAPEKSNFVQTCNLLSQFLKGRVSIRDLSHGIGVVNTEASGKFDMSHGTTMDFLTNIEKSTQDQEMAPIDPNPQSTVNGTSRTVEEGTNAAASISKEAPKEAPKAAQLTIFYSGKVMVFDEFPADKARAVMLLASKSSPQSARGVFQTAGVDKLDQPADGAAVVATSTSVDPPKPMASPPPLPPPPVPPPTQPAPAPAPAPAPGSSDLPIARRSSLHRFLEKRKDRATARAPYQVHNNPLIQSKNEGPSSKNEASPSKNEGSSSKNEGSSSKNEASSSKTRDQIDLNFKL